MKSQEISKASRVHPLGTMYVCPKFPSHASISCGDIWFWIKAVQCRPTNGPKTLATWNSDILQVQPPPWPPQPYFPPGYISTLLPALAVDAGCGCKSRGIVQYTSNSLGYWAEKYSEQGREENTETDNGRVNERVRGVEGSIKQRRSDERQKLNELLEAKRNKTLKRFEVQGARASYKTKNTRGFERMKCSPSQENGWPKSAADR